MRSKTIWTVYLHYYQLIMQRVSLIMYKELYYKKIYGRKNINNRSDKRGGSDVYFRIYRYFKTRKQSDFSK